MIDIILKQNQIKPYHPIPTRKSDQVLRNEGKQSLLFAVPAKWKETKW